MTDKDKFPREGDLYRCIKVDEHVFELRYGYYADFEREGGDPVVIYPNLLNQRLYTKDGKRLVTAMQEPCKHYTIPHGAERNDCCEDCIHYSEPGDEIGICLCRENRRE